MSKTPSRYSSDPSVRTSAGYRKTVLPSGLRVVTEEILHVRSVSIGVWVDTGSRDEDAQENGIAHFIEHMVFKGTKRRSIAQIARSLESVGGYLNAFTGKEHTCFYARVLDSHLDLAADVLADLLGNPTFPAAEVRKEQGVVIEELRNAEDDPDDIIHDLLDAEIFGDHSLGRPVIGTERNIRSFTHADLVDYRRRRYTADRCVLAVAGNIRHDDVVRLANREFAGLPLTWDGPSRSKPRAVPGALKRQTKPIQQAHLCIGTTAYSIHDKERYPLLVLNTLLGDGMSSRLFQAVRERHGYAYSVYSFANTMTDTGTFGVYAGMDRKQIDRVNELIWKELDRLRTTPVPAAELQRTKDQVTGSMMLSLESIPNRMMRLGGSELALGRLPSLDDVAASIRAVTRDDILRVADDLMRRERFATVILEPDPKGPPTA